MFVKLGEAIEINSIENTESCIPVVSSDILDNFKKFATNLKKIAPKAEDFLYFSAVMMHAAEAAALNDDGSTKLTFKGEPVKVSWDKSNGTWKWISNDSNIKAYRNANGDIFPEEELIKAHKKWVGKPLCIDHKSNSVDHIRGFIVDTYYDRQLKRVIALCALDKQNYPDLARKVKTGYSSSVSMGTAVGRAICYDCGKVARTEKDFCEHMRSKTCYGEINTDLNPIELSIVVNGADPKAHIKHIIAAANTLNNYVSKKEEELNKIVYSAIINNGDKSISIESKNLDEFKHSFNSTCEEFEKLKQITQKATNNSILGHSAVESEEENSEEMSCDSPIAPAMNLELAPPTERYASNSNDTEENLVTTLRNIIAGTEEKLNQIKQLLDQKETQQNKTSKEDNNMSGTISKKSYFQGGGGVNEPTPGKPKYPVDPTNDEARLHDKHMEVDDLGPIDGLHPGTKSSGMSELERKKMLARAEAEERAIRRAAVVSLAKQALEQNKQAYFQGGGGVNEPTPGKQKYPVDKLYEAYKGDKHMVGQKPFPSVGDVEGLHPSPESAEIKDEKKRKELLQRASLRAKFVKASKDDGAQDIGNSGWEVFLGNKLLLTATVNELSGNRANSYYNKIATKEFGAKLIENVKTYGAEKVRSLFKNAQATAPTAAPAPAAVPAPAPELAMPTPELTEPQEVSVEDAVNDASKQGDQSEGALELSEKIRDLSSDLVEAVRALKNEQVEMGKNETSAPSTKEASELNNLRKELNGELIRAMNRSVEELNNHKQELDMLSGMYARGSVDDSNKDFVKVVSEDAYNEAKSAIAEGLKLMVAFVRYAHASETLHKRAESEHELEELTDEPMDNYDEGNEGDSMENNEHDEFSSLADETDSDLSDIEKMLDEDVHDESLVSDEDSTEDSNYEMSEEEAGETQADKELAELLAEMDKASADDDNDVITTNDPSKAVEITKKDPNIPVTVKAEDQLMQTAEGRVYLRSKLAAEAIKFSPLLDKAHPEGSVKMVDNVKDDLSVVETLEDQNKAMMDVVSATPKVRKEAEAINKLIVEGKLDPSDLDALVTEGLDREAVEYYKKYYGQVEGGSEFASELLKEHVKAELEQELNLHKLKLARAYELTYEMVDRGLCHNDRSAISTQVDEIMKFNDDNFESLKRVVAKHPVLRKEASKIPQVGMIGLGDAQPTGSDNLYAQLSAALSRTSKRMF